MLQCDPISGSCQIPEQAPAATRSSARTEKLAVHYVGDPMCSWCWGISGAVRSLATFCQDEGIPFTVTMGGLRAGGGDPWSLQFKEFLRNEWAHIASATGQSFGFKLLERQSFNYDTEPACRAVAAAQLVSGAEALAGLGLLRFFSAIQKKFYVEGEDPTQATFYRSICEEFGIDADSFLATWNSEAAVQAVQRDFQRCREMGVRSFPTLLLEHDGTTTTLANGYVTGDQLIARIKTAVAR